LGELDLDSADVMVFGGANVGVQIVLGGEGVVFDLSDFGFLVLADLLLEVFELLLFGPTLGKNHLSANLKGVTILADIGDLVLGTVGDAGVGHGVTVVSVGVELNEERAVLNNELTSELDGLSHSEHVLSVNSDSGDLSAAGVEVSAMGSTVLGSSHAVHVVFADVDHREFPETSHVGSLVELALVGSAVTVHGNTEVFLSLVLLTKGQTGSNGQLSAHNSVSTIEVVLGVIEMHGASLSKRRTSFPCHHFSENSVGSVTTGVGSAMVAVGSDQAVVTGHCHLHALRNGLLSIVQMQKASDFSLLVEHVGENLHSSHDSQFLESFEELFLCGGSLRGVFFDIDLVDSQKFGLNNETAGLGHFHVATLTILKEAVSLEKARVESAKV